MARTVPAAFFKRGSLNAGQKLVFDKLVRAMSVATLRNPVSSAPWLPPITWSSGATATWTAATPYAPGMMVENIAGTHQFICWKIIGGGVSGGAQPAGFTNPGNAAATPWGCGEISDNAQVVWFWAGPVRTTAAQPGAPAVTVTAATPATLTLGFNVGSLIPVGEFPQKFALSGGVPLPFGGTGGYVAPASNTTPGPTSNIGVLSGGNYYQWLFGSTLWETDAPFLSFNMVSSGSVPATGGGLIVEVDDLRVSDAPCATAVTISPAWINLDFRISGGRKRRKFRVYGANNSAALGVSTLFVAQQDQIWAPANVNYLRLMFLGNSFTGGGNSFPITSGLDLANQVGRLLGIEDAWNNGQGGTGYLNVPANTYSFRQRLINDVVPNAPDILYVHGDSSDSGLSPAALFAEVLGFWELARRYLPSTLFVQGGTWPSATGPSAAVLAVDATLEAAVSASNDQGLLFLPVSDDFAGPWDTGTGNVAATTGVGSADIHVSDDGAHPTQIGIDYKAQRIASALRNAVQQ